MAELVPVQLAAAVAVQAAEEVRPQHALPVCGVCGVAQATSDVGCEGVVPSELAARWNDLVAGGGGGTATRLGAEQSVVWLPHEGIELGGVDAATVVGVHEPEHAPEVAVADHGRGDLAVAPHRLPELGPQQRAVGVAAVAVEPVVEVHAAHRKGGRDQLPSDTSEQRGVESDVTGCGCTAAGVGTVRLTARGCSCSCSCRLVVGRGCEGHVVGDVTAGLGRGGLVVRTERRVIAVAVAAAAGAVVEAETVVDGAARDEGGKLSHLHHARARLVDEAEDAACVGVWHVTR